MNIFQLREILSIYMPLFTAIFISLLIVFWKKRLQRNMQIIPSESTSLALMRGSSCSESTKILPDPRLTIGGPSHNILSDFPHSIAMQKQILMNLRIVEYKLVEMEHFLITRDMNYHRSIMDVVECTESGDTQ